MKEKPDVPHVPLGLLPTPLESAPRLGAALAVPNLYIKRDDLIGLAFGGNKIRKLEYVLADALREGADTLITSAGPQSNRARMTAIACRRVGLRCVLLLCGDYGERRLIGNLLLDDIFGAEVHFIDAASSYAPEALLEARRIAASLKADGHKCYITEVGSQAEPLVDYGYYKGAHEIIAQCRGLNFVPGTILLGCGSGSQQAGLLVGLRAAGIDTKVIGIALSANAAEKSKRIVRGHAETLIKWLGLDLSLSDDDVQVDDRFSQDGHGVPGEASIRAVRLCAESEGLLIDPIYVGKIISAMPTLRRDGLIDATKPTIVWHTGGASALFMHCNSFAPSSQQALLNSRIGAGE